jgi:gluconate kinase
VTYKPVKVATDVSIPEAVLVCPELDGQRDKLVTADEQVSIIHVAVSKEEFVNKEQVLQMLQV